MSNLGSFLKEIDKGKMDIPYQSGGMVQVIDRIPTGFYGLDSGIGGGFPVGKISVVYGLESAMKTTICLKAIASAQKKWPDKKAVFIDVEGHFDWTWADKMGVDIETLQLFTPSNAETTVDTVCKLLLLEDVSIIVLDSLAALITEEEANKSAADSVMATTARMINRMYRLSGRNLGQARMRGLKPTLLFINQVRMRMVQHGDPETLPGGPSFKFASSLTLRLSGFNEVMKSEHATLPSYRKVRWIVKKNKVPITQGNGEIFVALRPIKEFGLSVGECYDWPSIRSHLTHFELLRNAGSSKWELVWADTGTIETYKTQKEIQKKMYADPEFATNLKNMLMNYMINHEESTLLDSSGG